MSIKKCFLFLCLAIMIGIVGFFSYMLFQLRDKKACFPGYKNAADVEKLLLSKFPPGSNIYDLKDFLNKNKGGLYNRESEDETIFRCENLVFPMLQGWIVEVRHNSGNISKIEVTNYLTGP